MRDANHYAVQIVRWVAWFILVVGILVTVLLVVTVVGVLVTSPAPSPLLLLTPTLLGAVGFVLGTVFLWAILLVQARNAENLEAIRKVLISRLPRP